MKLPFGIPFFLSVAICILEVTHNISATAHRSRKALSAPYGSFHSPGFPKMYPNLLRCSWSITVDNGFFIMLRFTAFDVEFYPHCTYDFVKITERENQTLGTFCGSAEKNNDEAIKDGRILKSLGNRIHVVFRSDYSNEEVFKGFKAHYRAADINECKLNNGGCDHYCHNVLGSYYCSCRINYQLKADDKSCDYVLCKNVVLRSLKGTITSPEYPNHYPKHLDCSWRISVSRGYRVVLAFQKFKIESHPDVKCPYDYLLVVDGRKQTRLCGRKLPRNITSTSTSLTIRFVTDNSTHMKGFLAQYYSEGVKCPTLNVPENGEMNATGFSFKDEVTFSCFAGYNLKGFSKVQCRHTGEWTEQSPFCEPVSCGQPRIPHRARMIGNRFTFEETVRFECDDFYEADGEEELICEENGYWSDDVPECVPVCGNSSFANIYRQSCRGNIVGGVDAVRGSYPWHALLKIDGVGKCGASLLNDYWVITAAHCVVKRRQVIWPRRVTIVLGLHNKSMENETQVKEMRVGQIFEHGAYNPMTFEADLALLRLTEPAIMNDFVKPICLPDTESSSNVIRPGARGVVAGWGRATSTLLFPNILQEVCLPVVNISTCRQAYINEKVTVTHDMFCTGPAGGGKDVCKGDSGGGYIFQDPGDSRWFLGGMVSWGSIEGCALPNKYSVYLKVEDYLDWIQDRIFR